MAANSSGQTTTSGGADLPPVFLINMARDVERRRLMTERLAAIGLPFTMFEAVAGSALDLASHPHYDGRRRQRVFGRDMTAGEVGCLLSHRAIMQRMVDDNLPAAVILEDDVIFEADFPDVLRALMTCPRHWDIIRFLGSDKIYRLGRRLIAPLYGRYRLARIPGTHGGAHAYLLTQAAAKVLLAHTTRAWMPIDTLQGRCWMTGLESLVVHPCPLHTDPAAGSTIEDKRFDKTLQISGLDRALYPLRRFAFKMGETIGKRVVWWGSWLRDGRGRTES